MKIYISDKEKMLLVDTALSNLDYWMYEADHREFYREIIGALVILDKLNTGDIAEHYIKEYYNLLKGNSCVRGSQMFSRIISKRDYMK